jgi:hypothetical protein
MSTTFDRCRSYTNTNYLLNIDKDARLGSLANRYIALWSSSIVVVVVCSRSFDFTDAAPIDLTNCARYNGHITENEPTKPNDDEWTIISSIRCTCLDRREQTTEHARRFDACRFVIAAAVSDAVVAVVDCGRGGVRIAFDLACREQELVAIWRPIVH